jgi:hypothetical protein
MDHQFVRAFWSDDPRESMHSLATGVHLHGIRHLLAEERDEIAFVGNSVAFHPGRWSRTCSASDVAGGVMTQHGVICYECRSNRGVLTVDQVGASLACPGVHPTQQRLVRFHDRFLLPQLHAQFCHVWYLDIRDTQAALACS